MTYSTTVPHFNLHDEFDITKLKEIQTKYESLKETKVSIFAFITKSFSMALLKHPRMNSTYYPETSPHEYTINHFHNISIAIDSPNGLAAPNIKNV